MANSVDPDQIGAICSGSMLFASILNSSVILDNYLRGRLQLTKFSDAFFLGALRVKLVMDFWRCLNRSSTVAESGSFLVAPWYYSWAFGVNQGINCYQDSPNSSQFNKNTA